MTERTSEGLGVRAEELRAEHGLLGLAVGLVDRAGVLIGCAGTVSVGGAPVAPDTVFRIASVTKTMTAIGVMQLRDEARLALEDAVNRHIRGFVIEPPAGAPPVTFKHLLTHTAGIGEIPSWRLAVRPQAWGFDKAGSAGVDLAGLYRGRLRTEVPAGAKWAYANHGFAILGRAIEDVTQTPLADRMHRRLFGPLGMTSTSYVRWVALEQSMATGHVNRRGPIRPVKDYDRSLLGAGAVRSTITDMARYTRALLAGGELDGQRVLDASTLQEMFTQHYTPDPRVGGMGLGFVTPVLAGRRVVGHDGNLPGFASAILIAPDNELGVVVLTNTATMFGAHQIADTLLRDRLRIPTPSMTPAHPSDATAGRYGLPPGMLTNFRTRLMLGTRIEVLTQRAPTLQTMGIDPALRHGVRLQRSSLTPTPTVSLHGLDIPVAFTSQPPALVIGYPMFARLNQRRPPATHRIARSATAGACAATCLWFVRRLRRG